MYTMGIDIGSSATKAVILGDDDRIRSKEIELTGGDNLRSAEKVFQNALLAALLNEEDVHCVVTTGYGRKNVPFADRHLTEISCHALGLNFLCPNAKMILDIGGQDCKVIHLDGNGQVLDFAMNDKCSAGTGRFLEVIANTLGVPLEKMGLQSTLAKTTIRISSMCTVFAESEVVSQVAKGSAIPDIIKGVHDAIAERAVMLLNRLGLREPIAMTGGVAQNIGVVRSIENRLQKRLVIPESPQIIGALGAAIYARKRVSETIH